MAPFNPVGCGFDATEYGKPPRAALLGGSLPRQLNLRDSAHDGCHRGGSAHPYGGSGGPVGVPGPDQGPTPVLSPQGTEVSTLDVSLASPSQDPSSDQVSGRTRSCHDHGCGSVQGIPGDQVCVAAAAGPQPLYGRSRGQQGGELATPPVQVTGHMAMLFANPTVRTSVSSSPAQPSECSGASGAAVLARALTKLRRRSSETLNSRMPYCHAWAKGCCTRGQLCILSTSKCGLAHP